MIGCALTDWHPPLGELVWWTTVDEEAVRARSVASATGPSFLQHDHLTAARVLRDRGLPHRAVVSVATELTTPLDEDAMTRALTDFVRTHDELRSHFDVRDDGSITRWVAPADAITLRAHREPAPADHTALVDVLHARIDTDAVHDRLPGWSVGAIDTGSGFAVHITIDHSHTDGSAAIAALQEIVARYRAHVAGTDPLVAPAGSHIDHVADEQRRAASVTPDDPLVDHWREVLVAHGRRVPRTALDLGLVGTDPAPAVAVRAHLLTAADTELCADRARAVGCSLSALVFAVIARAQWRVTGEVDYFTSTVLSTRDPQFPGTQGWMCTFAPIALRADTPDIDALVREAGTQLRHARDHRDRPVHAVLAHLAATGDFVPDGSSPQMVSYLDLRRLADVEAPEIVAARAMPGVGRTRNANLWVNRDADGMTLLSHVPDNDVARASIGALRDALVAELTAYAAGHGVVSHAEHVGAQVL